MIFDKDNWQEIAATVKKNRLRTVLTMLGVAWGIFMLVIMLGAGNGLRHGVLRDFGGTASNSFFIWTQETSKPYKGFRAGRGWNFTTTDWPAIAGLPEIEVVAPINQLGGYFGNANVIRGLKTGSFTVKGETPEMNEIQSMKLVPGGRFINYNDLSECRKVCVIGKRVKEILFKPSENPLGKYIRISGVYFMVIGVIDPQKGGQEGQEEQTKVSIPFTTFQRAFNYGDRIGWFVVKAKRDIPAALAEEKVMLLLKERHKIHPEDRVAIGHWNMGLEFGKLNGLFNGIEILIWIVGSGTLLAGVIGISNIMLIVVKERTREIGVKRALGATPMHVIIQILSEALIITSLSGYLGLLGGIYLLEGLNSLLGENQGSLFYNPTVDLKIALYALLIIIVGGLFAGLIPARRAVAIHPVEALRYE